ncbi:MAG TPA: DHH family phosphoesterase [Candidatus Magasanikbacteria bacterium]|nr:DHH family phosphoesterase [Candidatus Magasanikbacteria bacterium]
MLNTVEQFKKLIDSSRSVLIVFANKNSEDCAAGANALKKYIKKMNKFSEIVAEDFKTPKQLSFLSEIEKIKPAITNLQKMIIKVDISRTKLETISYDVKDSTLSIFLTPKEGFITKNDLRTAQSTYKYDLIITIGVSDLEALGQTFFNNTDLFYRTPIVNFDNHAGNENFGQINFNEITATSNCEVIFNTLTKINETLIDKDIATSLLTGMIAQTKSFKTPNVTPYTLNLASKLMNLGADRELIVQNLYRTKTLSILKLWGQALTKLQNIHDIGLFWTAITIEDFNKAGAREDDLKDIIGELISNSPEAKAVLLLYENKDNEISGILNTEKEFDAMNLLQKFTPTGNRKQANFKISGKNIKQAENEVIEELKKKMK